MGIPPQCVYVVNLARRPDRLRQFFSKIESCGWPGNWPKPEPFPAIDGDVVGVPPTFTQGGGAYGCRCSHVQILQRCLMQHLEPVLVMEDDADFRPGFPEAVKQLMVKVPSDWEGIMLGGQHHSPPERVGDGIVRVKYAQRTHAYIARGNYLRGLQQRWGNATVHIDWLMRDWQQSYKVYAPSPWLVGQAGGRSDIRGAEKPPEWWIEPVGNEPVVLLHASRAVVEELRDRGFHGGMQRNTDGIDIGLANCYLPGIEGPGRTSRLAKWIMQLQWECAGGALIVTAWHPRVTAGELQRAWRGPVYEIAADSADSAIAQLPDEVRSRLVQSTAAQRKPLVILKAPRQVMEQLRHRGFHAGYWRDSASGIDNGLIRIFSASTPIETRQDELRKWCNELGREADRDGGIVTVWHPDATREAFRQVTDREVILIEGKTAEQVEEKFRLRIGMKA